MPARSTYCATCADRVGGQCLVEHRGLRLLQPEGPEQPHRATQSGRPRGAAGGGLGDTGRPYPNSFALPDFVRRSCQHRIRLPRRADLLCSNARVAASTAVTLEDTPGRAEHVRSDGPGRCAHRASRVRGADGRRRARLRPHRVRLARDSQLRTRQPLRALRLPALPALGRVGDADRESDRRCGCSPAVGWRASSRPTSSCSSWSRSSTRPRARTTSSGWFRAVTLTWIYSRTSCGRPAPDMEPRHGALLVRRAAVHGRDHHCSGAHASRPRTGFWISAAMISLSLPISVAWRWWVAAQRPGQLRSPTRSGCPASSSASQAARSWRTSPRGTGPGFVPLRRLRSLATDPWALPVFALAVALIGTSSLGGPPGSSRRPSPQEQVRSRVRSGGRRDLAGRRGPRCPDSPVSRLLGTQVVRRDRPLVLRHLPLALSRDRDPQDDIDLSRWSGGPGPPPGLDPGDFHPARQQPPTRGWSDRPSVVAAASAQPACRRPGPCRRWLRGTGSAHCGTSEPRDPAPAGGTDRRRRAAPRAPSQLLRIPPSREGSHPPSSAARRVPRRRAPPMPATSRHGDRLPARPSAVRASRPGGAGHRERQCPLGRRVVETDGDRRSGSPADSSTGCSDGLRPLRATSRRSARPIPSSSPSDPESTTPNGIHKNDAGTPTSFSPGDRSASSQKVGPARPHPPRRLGLKSWWPSHVPAADRDRGARAAA